jgi:hypothetical protein
MASCSAPSNCGSSPCSPPSGGCAWLRSRRCASNLTGHARDRLENARSGRRNRRLDRTKEHRSASITRLHAASSNGYHHLPNTGRHHQRLAHRNSDSPPGRRAPYLLTCPPCPNSGLPRCPEGARAPPSRHTQFTLFLFGNSISYDRRRPPSGHLNWSFGLPSSSSTPARDRDRATVM